MKTSQLQSNHEHPSNSTTNLNPITSRHTQKLNSNPFTFNPSFTPFKPHQQQQPLSIGINSNNPQLSIPHQTSSTLSLAAFACDIEKEITEKIFKKLNLNQYNPNNVLMVTMCKLIDDITCNINNNMKDLRNEFNNSLNLVSKQQQQQQNMIKNLLNNEYKKLGVLLTEEQNKKMVNISNCIKNVENKIKSSNDTLLITLNNHQEQFLQEINSIKINDNNNFKLVNKKLKNLKKESNGLNSNLKHQLKQINKLNNTSTTLLDNIKCFKFNTLTSEKQLKVKNKKQTNNKNNIIKNIKSIKNKQSNGKNTKSNNKIKQNSELTEELSKVNNNLKKLNDKFDVYIISNKKSIISQNIMMSNIKKVKKNIGDIANNNIKTKNSTDITCINKSLKLIQKNISQLETDKELLQIINTLKKQIEIQNDMIKDDVKMINTLEISCDSQNNTNKCQKQLIKQFESQIKQFKSQIKQYESQCELYNNIINLPL